MTYTYTIYEITLQVTFPCQMLPPAPKGAVPDVILMEGRVPRSLNGAVAAGINWQAAPGRFLLFGGRKAGRFLVQGGNRIILERNPAAEESMLAAHLLASVLAALLRQRGLLVLHANAAVTPVGAVAISGETGAGKSTTLAALLGRGCAMLADDITVLRLNLSGEAEVVPGIAKLNLCEDAAVRMGHAVVKLPRNPLRRIKVMVPAGDLMVLLPVPLQSIYLLKQGATDEMRTFSLNGAQKFAALQECIYGPLFPEEHPGQFNLLATVTNQIKIFRLERPASGWSVDAVAGVVLNG